MEYSYKTYAENENVVVCNHCGKKYLQIENTDNVGIRKRSYDTCPYCEKNNGSSSEVEYINKKLDE